jgi:hypothetical protein
VRQIHDVPVRPATASVPGDDRGAVEDNHVVVADQDGTLWRTVEVDDAVNRDAPSLAALPDRQGTRRQRQ